MDFVRKNKNLVIIIVALVTLLVALVVFSRLRTSEVTPRTDNSRPVKTLKAEDIGLEVALRGDKKAVIMTITKLDGIDSIEYEVNYDAKEEVEGEEQVVPRGAVGSPIKVNSSDSAIKREILLGTCSASVCKYDKVVGSIKFLIKVNFTNGDVGAVEASIDLED